MTKEDEKKPVKPEPVKPDVKPDTKPELIKPEPVKELKKDAGEELLKAAWNEVDKKFGKGSVMHGKSIVQDVQVIPTGSIRLDIALGVGGLPRGRIVEIFGQESSGKTTLLLEIIKNVQRVGGRGMLIDAEHAVDADYASRVGVNIDKLYLSQPDSGEQALEIVETFCKTNALDIIAVDSVAGLVPKAELEGDIGDQVIGALSRLMSQSLRRLASVVSKSKTCLVFTNQIREKIGVMFGNPETTPGGRALKFHSSVRLEIRRVQTIKHGDVAIGNLVRATVQKNKVAPPFRKAEFEIIFGKGIRGAKCLLNLGEQCKLIDRSGTWFSIKGKKIGNGEDQAVEWLERSPLVAAEIDTAIRRMFLNKDIIVEKQADDEPQEV
jgi:recombination protein RecA